MRLLSIVAAVLTSAAVLSPTVAMAETSPQIFSKKTATATSNGKSAGAALKALYTQYKADGKLNMKNLSNLMNLATLANNIQDLKGQGNKSAFYKDFAAGLVTGSGNLVNSSNSNAVMGGLTNLVNNVDLSGLQGASQGTGTLSNATEISNSVNGILNLLKK